LNHKTSSFIPRPNLLGDRYTLPDNADVIPVLVLAGELSRYVLRLVTLEEAEVGVMVGGCVWTVPGWTVCVTVTVAVAVLVVVTVAVDVVLITVVVLAVSVAVMV
jgi:hypothetical protein